MIGILSISVVVMITIRQCRNAIKTSGLAAGDVDCQVFPVIDSPLIAFSFLFSL